MCIVIPPLSQIPGSLYPFMLCVSWKWGETIACLNCKASNIWPNKKKTFGLHEFFMTEILKDKICDLQCLKTLNGQQICITKNCFLCIFVSLEIFLMILKKKLFNFINHNRFRLRTKSS